MDLDKIDINIISILSENSRTNYSQIEKKIKLSNDSVKTRVAKLIEKGIIKSYKMNLNYSYLGFLEYDIYFKLKNYTENELKTIIKYLNENKYVTWIGTCFGNYDLRISVVVNENKQVKEFINEFELKFNKHYQDSQIVFLIEKYKINQNKIISNLFNIKQTSIEMQKQNIENVIQSQSKTIKLEEIEKKILMELNKKPNSTLVDISKKVNLTPEGLKYRINELQNKKVIKSFSIILDGNKLNKIWAVFLFKLNNENSKEILRYIQNINNVSAFVQIMGNWNYSISVFANNVQEIHNILMGFRNKFPNNIKEYELLLIFETYKYPSIPNIVFE